MYAENISIFNSRVRILVRQTCPVTNTVNSQERSKRKEDVIRMLLAGFRWDSCPSRTKGCLNGSVVSDFLFKTSLCHGAYPAYVASDALRSRLRIVSNIDPYCQEYVLVCQQYRLVSEVQKKTSNTRRLLCRLSKRVARWTQQAR